MLFRSASYRCYLPVADSYARPITAAVIDDEAEHLSYAERWLGQRRVGVVEGVCRISTQALPITLAILRTLSDDLKAVGIDPMELLGCFTLLFQQSLEAIGLEAAVARRILIRAAAASLAPA